MHRRPSRARAARAVLLPALLAALALAGCWRLAQPAQDPETIAALDRLAVEASALFDAIEAGPGAAGHPGRSAAYGALDAGAGALAARAEARRPAGWGPEAEMPTAAFLGDFRASLARLAEHDAARAAIGLGPAPQVVALRRAAMADALSDAIFYERHALSRRR
jgi:hypothetical protein